MDMFLKIYFQKLHK